MTHGSARERLRSLATVCVLAAVVSWVAIRGVSAGATRSAPVVATAKCNPAVVHYRSYKGVQVGLRPIPWIAASPASAGLVGFLFYYDAANPWKQAQLPTLRIYSGGQSPDGRIAMKVLWERRHPAGASATNVLRMRGRRLDGPGSFAERLNNDGASQYPSILNVPAPGCWRLTLKTGTTTAHVTVFAI
jgi:hypothetical protein